MAFSDSVVMMAWRRSGGQCECRRKEHQHGYSGRCTKLLRLDQRGNDNSPFGWEAHHKIAVSEGGSDLFANCEILCIECHKKTYSYGQH